MAKRFSSIQDSWHKTKPENWENEKKKVHNLDLRNETFIISRKVTNRTGSKLLQNDVIALKIKKFKMQLKI